MSSSLEGRVAVVFGVANKRSIAWSIAQGLHQAGATLIITYQNERLELEAKDLIASLPGAAGFMCDVSDDAAIDHIKRGHFDNMRDEGAGRGAKQHVRAVALGGSLGVPLLGRSYEPSPWLQKTWRRMRRLQPVALWLGCRGC